MREVDPYWFEGKKPENRLILLQNFANGNWRPYSHWLNIPSPMEGDDIVLVPDTRSHELSMFVDDLSTCPIYGLHNPLLNQKRYLDLGEVCFRAGLALSDPENADYFARLISLVMPKDHQQSMAEVVVTARFLKTFAGNNVRFLGRGMTVPGDGAGHEAVHYPWPYGPVAIITPFNFPLEIPALQLMGALFMGNEPVLKSDPRVAVVAESFVRLLLACGLSPNDLCLLHGGGEVAEALVTTKKSNGEFLIQVTQFTGSSRVGRHLTKVTEGRVLFEDSGLGWKILGPNFKAVDVEAVAKQCDADAYAASGQKCSAQSLLFPHEKWLQMGLYAELKALAGKRNFDDLSLGPVLTWNNERLHKHVGSVANIPQSKILWGGQTYQPAGSSVPSAYGAYQPTAIEIPLSQINLHQHILATEVFGPFQLIIPWKTQEDLILVIDFINNGLNRYLTAGIVDDNEDFCRGIAQRTKPGTTYYGIKAPTTGAPEWHHFGPTGHPANCGIGTPEDIIRTWSQTRLVCRRRDGLVWPNS